MDHTTVGSLRSQRIFTSTTYFGTHNAGGRPGGPGPPAISLLDRLRIRCGRSGDEDHERPCLTANIVNLSESSWQEIQAHPIPVDVRVVRELTSIAGYIDVWLC
jgi:hypothetical protein